MYTAVVYRLQVNISSCKHRLTAIVTLGISAILYNGRLKVCYNRGADKISVSLKSSFTVILNVATWINNTNS